ncbi:MAG: DUF2807 domain-containing protein [Burkholderiales bacterium]|nr:DUF2807 domain-containing protein [Burkholderiales bacterium]
MKKFNLLPIFAISALFGLTLTACDKKPQVQEPANVTNVMTVSNTAAASVVPSTSVLVGSGVSTTQTLVLNQPVKNVLADVSATFIYDPSVGDKIVVTADDNIQNQIKVSVEQGVLRLAPMTSSVQQKTPIQITWGGTAPEQLDIKGSSKVIVHQFKGSQLNVKISGSGAVDADGQTQQLNIDVTGSGSFVGAQLVAQKARLNVSGSGNIVAQVKQEVSGSIADSGSVVVSGNPKNRAVTNEGSGQVVYQ